MHRPLRLAFVVTTTAAACGGNTFSGGDDAGAGGTGGTAGSAGSGGTTAGAGGTGGNPPNCPATPPSGYDPCPPGLPSSARCTYEVVCEGGPARVTFQCGASPYGSWQVVDSPCGWEGDSCAGTSLMCWGGEWRVPQGTNPPPPCPHPKPEPLSECEAYGFGPPTCGYPCTPGKPEAGWTLGSCTFPPSRELQQPFWFFDGACPNDCSPHERDIADALAAAAYCNSDDECVQVDVGCSRNRMHCAGVAYGNAGTLDLLKIGEAVGKLSLCGVSGCPLCDAIPPPPACVSGFCRPGF